MPEEYVRYDSQMKVTPRTVNATVHYRGESNDDLIRIVGIRTASVLHKDLDMSARQKMRSVANLHGYVIHNVRISKI